MRVLRIANFNRYVGDRGAALTLRSSLAFRWAIVMNDQIHESEVCVRADNASERGVPFPAAWRKELNIGAAQPVVDVDALARSAVLRVHEGHSLPEDAKLDCRTATRIITCTFSSCIRALLLRIRVHMHVCVRS